MGPVRDKISDLDWPTLRSSAQAKAIIPVNLKPWQQVVDLFPVHSQNSLLPFSPHVDLGHAVLDVHARRLLREKVGHLLLPGLSLSPASRPLGPERSPRPEPGRSGNHHNRLPRSGLGDFLAPIENLPKDRVAKAERRMRISREFAMKVQDGLCLQFWSFFSLRSDWFVSLNLFFVIHLQFLKLALCNLITSTKSNIPRWTKSTDTACQ